MQHDELDAHLDTVLIGGREHREVVIADYDQAWPQRFELERDRIKRALRGVARRIEHVGSTSVPGLAAKPIVDLLVAVDDADDEQAFGPELQRAGYELRVREPRHRMYRTPQLDVQVHVWSDDDREVARYLAFRDRLRESSADRGEYERLKRSLAQREWSDINRYAQAKGPLIEAILARAAGPDASPIRAARAGDAAAIALLLGELGHQTTQAAARIQLARVLDRRDAGVLIYEFDREPVALVAYETYELIYRSRPQCRLTALVVRADHRRRGIARELIAAVEAVARRRDCHRIELTTRPDRPDALSLYLACGFSERPRRLVKMIDVG